MATRSKKIVLCVNPDCEGAQSVALQAQKALEDAGYATVISIVQVRRSTFTPGASLNAVSLKEAALGADMLIIFGGDGTILKTARAVMKEPVPLLGVNLGHKGFMADVERNELDLMLRAAAGDYAPMRRMMLDIALIRGGRTVFSDSALNDAVVGGTARAVNLSAFGDGRKITEYSGDGVIVATPTGSTAYSLSAGGPLVEPTAENIVITPICAHLMTARPFVLASERKVTIQTENNTGKSIWLSVDGCEPISMYDGDELHIKKSNHCAVMAHVSGKSFYDRAFNKFGG